ncbi:hypothetical protein ANN_20790 [Periplaneta americana]|uniref:Uncharacterized protein n=1 Tax=Periplaneta americana TaxID=6978 RepID=A0ABQ8SDK4_PERAM|nr:hypothetical protein ANN_20790 [Periplaneta americana]
MDLREVGYDDRDWINLAQDRDRWRAYLNRLHSYESRAVNCSRDHKDRSRGPQVVRGPKFEKRCPTQYAFSIIFGDDDDDDDETLRLTHSSTINKDLKCYDTAKFANWKSLK